MSCEMKTVRELLKALPKDQLEEVKDYAISISCKRAETFWEVKFRLENLLSKLKMSLNNSSTTMFCCRVSNEEPQLFWFNDFDMLYCLRAIPQWDKIKADDVDKLSNDEITSLLYHRKKLETLSKPMLRSNIDAALEAKVLLTDTRGVDFLKMLFGNLLYTDCYGIEYSTPSGLSRFNVQSGRATYLKQLLTIYHCIMRFKCEQPHA